jgi:hypothetical protein
MTISLRFLDEPIQYQPGEQHNKETSKRIRTHIAQHRRLKKKQLLLNQPRKQETDPLSGSFCLCSVDPPQSVSELEDTTSRAVQKQRAIADSYKICPRCRKLQFNLLSWSEKLNAVKGRVPSIYRWLEAEFDPFQSLPEFSLYKQSANTRRSMNEIKTHCKYHIHHTYVPSVL